MAETYVNIQPQVPSSNINRQVQQNNLQSYQTTTQILQNTHLNGGTFSQQNYSKNTQNTPFIPPSSLQNPSFNINSGNMADLQIQNQSCSWDNLRLHITNDKFYFEALDSPDHDVLAIDRTLENENFNNSYSSPQHNANHPQMTLLQNHVIPPARTIIHCNGFLGTIRLIAGNYLVLVTKRRRIGTLHSGHSIWKMEDFEMIAYNRNSISTLNPLQRQHNEMYKQLIQQILATPSFYFSNTYDITHSVQRLSRSDPNFYKLALIQRADERFLWNRHLLTAFFQQNSVDKTQISRFGMPIMHGFIAINNNFLNGRMFDWAIVSRRATSRAGTRYYMRGLDDNGDCANYVETEQILIYNRKLASLLQTRGSIPVFWSQRPNLKYKPDPKISATKDHLQAFKTHIHAQKVLYGDQLLVNLIKRKGSEGPLAEKMKNAIDVTKIQGIKYIHFDFHKECGNMGFHKVAGLLKQIKSDVDAFGYYMNDSGERQEFQKGNVRTNCIDCLDRTNVVQGMIGKSVLIDQLRRFGVLEVTENIEEHKLLEDVFKTTWADHGDAMSNQYTGTPALKSDFTRTGKRGFQGMANDVWKSGIRYINNNFRDGARQDGMDLFLGNYQVSEWEDISVGCPLIIGKMRLIGQALPFIFMVMVAMLFMALLMPTETFFEQVIYVGSSVTLFGIATKFFLKHGYEFVDAPKLVQTKSKSE